ncbi:hypothetical protein AX14_013108 [Amanita brunnescens Koide BX004]|nr:hypothetical protein AX14_013108 [Amanita brunnescens Koide BX004]
MHSVHNLMTAGIERSIFHPPRYCCSASPLGASVTAGQTLPSSPILSLRLEPPRNGADSTFGLPPSALQFPTLASPSPSLPSNLRGAFRKISPHGLAVLARHPQAVLPSYEHLTVLPLRDGRQAIKHREVRVSKMC